MTSQAEVEGLRMRAAQLRAEWRSVRAAAPETRLEKEREVEAEALKTEIASMEMRLMQEVKSSGGSAQDAIDAMARAAELERSVVKAHEVEAEDDANDKAYTEPPPNAYTSSNRAAAPAIPVPGNEDAAPVAVDSEGRVEAGDEKEDGGSR